MKKSLLMLSAAVAALCFGLSAYASPPAQASPAAQARTCAVSASASVAPVAAAQPLEQAGAPVATIGREPVLLVASPCPTPRVRIWPAWAVYAVPLPAAPPRPYPRT